ncbi:hypothetical protein [Micromonospora sp. KLBMP9576]|uniref:hypothetical protein n=1 Tax=Micromonospora sp. KLBMP9576 TaxID=3424769 RepID=UPI003D8DCB9E
MTYPPYASYPPMPGPVHPLIAYPHPITPPPGYAVLVVTVNRGPYLIPAPVSSRFKVAGQPVAIPGEGTWHLAVPPGQHDVRYTDFMGVPLITTTLVIHPGTAQHLSFRFGGWRNRVHDGQGTDVTKFGLWSNYSMSLIVLAVFLLVCCGLFGLL